LLLFVEVNELDIKNLIEVQNLEFSYRTIDDEGNDVLTKPVIQGVSFTVPQGQFLAILGHNGSGKSTLAKHFNGILTGTKGTVKIDGIDTLDDNQIYRIRQTVGMVFQNPDNQIVSAIVEEDVAFAPENLGIPPAEIRQRVDDALKTVGMYEYRRHSPHRLSGGQKQRVAVAGVIAMQPKCIVLDEPTAMLDPKGRKEVLNTVLRLNREKNITVIYITHYMEEAVFADRVIVMDKGKILMDDTPKVIFSRVEELKEVGLDVPQVTELVYELRKEGIDIPADIIYEDECVEAIMKLVKP
jgi:energy-coupling factor transport system ATP-binding protein